jgi:hypothetical protein
MNLLWGGHLARPDYASCIHNSLPDTDGIRLRTIWETTANNVYPRLITTFLKLDEKN